jgi:hypothetical protein
VGAANAAVGGRLGGPLLNEFGNGVATGTGVVKGTPGTGAGAGAVTGSWVGIPLDGVALGTSVAAG